MDVVRLVLTPEAHAAIDRGAAAAYPREACGLLVGHAGSREAGGLARVVHAQEVRNRAQAHDRFELDPGAIVAAEDAARAAGLELLGTWHSHPDAEAVPSATDREGFHGWLHVIVAARAGRPAELRAWRFPGVDAPALEVETITHRSVR